MTFLSPLLLLGLAALAVPILLHLLRRRETRTLVFPALRYLTRTTREHARIIRLRQLLLLALRISAVALLVFAGARLILPFGGRDHPPAGLALVVDNGLTSGAIIEGGRLLDSLIVRAEEALDRTGARDRVWIVTTGEPWRPSIPLSPDEARDALRELEPSHVTGDVTQAVSRASALLDAAAPELREIVVLSDLRDRSIPPTDLGSAGRDEVVRIAPPPSGMPGNRGVGEIQISGGLIPREGEQGEIQLQVEGTGVEGTAIRGYLEGRLVGATRAGSDGTAIIPLPPLSSGWVFGRVELDPDDLRGDDTGYFAFAVVPPPVVHLSGSASPFLVDALTVLDDAGRLALGSEAAAAVHFMGAGSFTTPPPGSVVIVLPPDDAALLPAANQILGELLPGWRFEAEPREEALETVVSGGSLLGHLPVEPIVRHAYRIVPAEGAGPMFELLSLADGRPWLIRVEAPAGPVIVLASPLTPEASGLPLSASMLPLVDLLTTAVISEVGPSGVPAGRSIPLPSGTVAVRTPDGAVRSLDGGSISFPRTGRAGIYQLLGPDEAVHALAAVNAIPPSPGPTLTMDAAAGRLQDVWSAAAPAEPWPGAVLSGRRGREVWRPMAAILLVVLLLESWLASSGGERRAPSPSRGREPSARPVHTE